MMALNGNEHSKNQAHPADYHRSTRVYVGGLNPTWNEHDVHRFMKKFGNIVNVFIARSGNRLSNGFGFVTFSTPAEAAGAYGTIYHQQQSITVKPSKMNYQHVNRTYMLDDDQNAVSPWPAEQAHEVVKDVSKIGSHSPKFDTRKSLPLSKHSKDFATFTTTSTIKSTVKNDVSVEVINLANNAVVNPSQSASESSLSQFGGSGLRASDKSTISKHSKEFYPRIDHIAGRVPPLMNAAAMTPVYHDNDDMSVVRFMSTDSANSATIVDSSVRINFYTFPGRL